MILEKKIVKPIITEKSIELGKDNRYVMGVAMSATKGSIAKELKNLFNVDALEVNTIIMPGKKKRILRTFRFAKTAKWKKAIVKIKEGQKIDIFPKEGN